MMFLFNWVIFRFYVNFQGCSPTWNMESGISGIICVYNGVVSIGWRTQIFTWRKWLEITISIHFQTACLGFRVGIRAHLLRMVSRNLNAMRFGSNWTPIHWRYGSMLLRVVVHAQSLIFLAFLSELRYATVIKGNTRVLPKWWTLIYSWLVFFSTMDLKPSTKICSRQTVELGIIFPPSRAKKSEKKIETNT